MDINYGWQPHVDGFGDTTGYWRYVPVDDSRGARQAGVTDDFALEFIPIEKWASFADGVIDPKAIEYQTGGTNIQQNDPRGWGVLSTVGPIALAAMAGGAAATQAGLLGGAAGGAGGTAGMSAAELAAMVEAGTVGTAGAAIEAAAVPGLEAFINGTITASQFASMNPTFATELANGESIFNGFESNYPTTTPEPFEANFPTNTPPTTPPPTNTVTPADYTPPPDWKPPPGSTAAERAAAAAAGTGTSSLVKSLASTLGISEGAAQLLLTTAPAIAGLFSDHDPQTTTNTSGTPQQVAVKNQIADATAARLPEYMQRDRQRADQQMGWANAAALVPQNYTLPDRVAGLTGQPPAFGANGAGMMGTYQPRGVMGLYR